MNVYQAYTLRTEEQRRIPSVTHVTHSHGPQERPYAKCIRHTVSYTRLPPCTPLIYIDMYTPTHIEYIHIHLTETKIRPPGPQAHHFVLFILFFFTPAPRAGMTSNFSRCICVRKSCEPYIHAHSHAHTCLQYIKLLSRDTYSHS